MKIFEIFEQLSVGEFSQLAIGNEGAGILSEANQYKLVPHINLGLTALYTRFNLKEGRVSLQLVPGKYSYDIHSKHLVTGNAEPTSTKYLVDADNTFTDDVLKIERVINDGGYDLFMNNEDEAYSVFTPTHTRLRVPADIVDSNIQLPKELNTSALELVYRANHTKILGDGADLELVDVALPDSHLEALLYFVASRIHNPIGMVNEFNAGNNYYAKYLAAVQELENKNLQVDRTPTNTRAQRGGWV